MKTYKIAVALLCGAGFASLCLLLLNLSSISFLTVLLVVPGGILAHWIVKSDDFGPPLLVLAANALVYSAVAYAGVSLLSNVTAEKLRLMAIRLALPAAILVSLACI